MFFSWAETSPYLLINPSCPRKNIVDISWLFIYIIRLYYCLFGQSPISFGPWWNWSSDPPLSHAISLRDIIGVFISSSSWFSPPPLNCLPTIPENPKNCLANAFHVPLLKLYQHLNFFKLTKGTPHTGPTPRILRPPPPINQSNLVDLEGGVPVD